MADQLQQPYKSLQKTLSRLVKKGLVSQPCRGFYQLNYGTWVKTHPTRGLMGSWVDVLRLHRVGLWASVPSVRSKMAMVGNWSEVDLANGCRYYHGHGVVFSSAEVRLFSDSCYYQRACKPVPVRNVALLYEDLVKTVDWYTHGLACPESVLLRDFELGLDVPCDSSLFEYLSRVEIYPPKRGMARVHLMFSKRDIALPFGLGSERELAKEWVEKVDLSARVLRDAEARVRVAYNLPSKKAEERRVLDVIKMCISEEEFIEMQMRRLRQGCDVKVTAPIPMVK